MDSIFRALGYHPIPPPPPEAGVEVSMHQHAPLLTDVAQACGFNKGVILFIVVLTSLLLYLSPLYALHTQVKSYGMQVKSYQEQQKEFQARACPTFMQNLAFNMSKPFQFQFAEGTTLISRMDANKTLADTISRKKLTVVLGQRQAGKSILVQNFLKRKKNVYVYTPEDGRKLVNDQEKACGNHNKDLLAETLRMLWTTPEEPAIVVFEIGHNKKDDEIISIYEALKTIVYDRQLPNIRGILVMSNHYSIDAFPSDHGRYETLWIGDLTTEEATGYTKSKKPDVNTSAYIEAVGRHLSQLQSALEKKSLEEWKEGVKRIVKNAAGSPDVQRIMRVLPANGTDFWHLRAANLTHDRKLLISLFRSDTSRTVLYSAEPGLFHWATPSHYSAFQELPSYIREEL